MRQDTFRVAPDNTFDPIRVPLWPLFRWWIVLVSIRRSKVGCLWCRSNMDSSRCCFNALAHCEFYFAREIFTQVNYIFQSGITAIPSR